MVLAEFGRIRWTWQNMAEFGGLGRIWQIAVRLLSDCRQIAVRLPSRGRSLVVESVETGGRV